MKIRNTGQVLLVALTASVFSVEMNAQDPRTPMTGQQCAVDCMKEKALSGDREAARNLALVYGKVDFKSMQYWHLIGAENGDPVSQYNYAFWLLKKGGPQHRERAIFWLKESAKNGDVDAQKLLSETKGQTKGP